MKKLVEMMLENLSTREVFLFRIACGACGTEYGGKKVRFSKAGIRLFFVKLAKLKAELKELKAKIDAK